MRGEMTPLLAKARIGSSGPAAGGPEVPSGEPRRQPGPAARAARRCSSSDTWVKVCDAAGSSTRRCAARSRSLASTAAPSAFAEPGRQRLEAIGGSGAAALVGIYLQGGDNNIFTQIGFLVLVGLASKNAILIVEFAKHLEEQGRDRVQAVLEAARLRLRPIVMTSIAFIMGVLPLVLADGAGAEVRSAMGAAVFSGMIGVTVFGLMLTPVFYVLLRRRRAETSALPAPDAEVASHA